MFDIDNELEKLKKEKFKPDEKLRGETRRRIRAAVRGGEVKRAAERRTVLRACCAFALAVAMIIVLSVNFTGPAQAAGYYTIDINPSISVAVDNNNVVISVTPENNDASEMLKGLDLTGLSFNDALRIIINTAVEDSYLKDNGNVLIAHFGSGDGIPREELSSIVTEESSNSVTVLVLSSGKGDYEKAKKSGDKAGIQLLLHNAKNMGIEDDDVDSVIKEVYNKDKDKNKDKDSSQNVTGNNGKNDNPGNDNSKGDNTGNNGNDNKKDNDNTGNGKGNDKDPGSSPTPKDSKNKPGNDKK